MEIIKLSFIVPVYNVEKYLRKCVDSLLAQDYDNYEIILVDDGSTDDSWQIIQEYVRRFRGLEDERVRGIHQENGGLSAARNTGIAAAMGEYLCFVDSDDYWEENVLGGLMEQIERDELDVLRFDYQNVRLKAYPQPLPAGKGDGTSKMILGEYEVFQPNKDPKRDVDYSESVVDGETFLNERLGPACYAVMFIVKRSLICKSRTTLDATRLEPEVLDPMDIDNSCLFKEGIYFEDVDWTPRMLLRAKRIASTPMVVYNYLWRTGSITLPTDSIKRKKVLEDKIGLIRGFQEQSQFVKDPVWFAWMTSFITMTILGILAHLPSLERKPYLRELKALDVFPLSIKKEKVFSHKVKIMIANISPSLYCIAMGRRHSKNH
jgi:glycosyltransferase involved in cell wall biosynthesis